MAFLKQTLTLSTVGASLITSNSFWFFDFFGIQPIKNDLKTEPIGNPTSNTPPSTKAPSKKIMPNMNGFKKAQKHTGIIGKSLKNEKLKPGTILSGYGFNFTLENHLSENKEKYMSKITSETLGDYTLTLFSATEEDYQNFPKEQIKISLFSQAAWYSPTGEDEYSKKLNRDEINKLFENQNEAKVKQLLLSLHKRLDWKKFGSESNLQNKFLSELVYPKNLEPLNDLKIKYFDNFDALKDYVHKKITTCEGEKIACIADKDELNIMDTDQPSFFENLENPKRN